jgi:hypothetical protein
LARDEVTDPSWRVVYQKLSGRKFCSP